jgi:shikimate kinase
VPNPTGDRTERASRVVLVGMMGSGKSTVGPLVARLLGAGFADSDEEVERSMGKSVQEIFETTGEASFRDAETDSLQTLLSGPGPIVIAAGGGAVLRAGNRELMHRGATVVWLRAGVPELAKRIGVGAGRPLLASTDELAPRGDVADRLEGLLKQRGTLYESVAHFVVDTDGLEAQLVADAVASVAMS